MLPTNSTIAQDGAPWARLRSALAPGCMVLAPLFLLAGEVLHPDRSTDPTRQVAIVSNHPGAWYLSHLLLFIGVLLTVPVVLRLMHVLSERSPRLAFLGGGLAGVGAICFAGLLTIGFVVWQMAAPGADQHQMAALFRRLFHAPGFIIPFEVLPLGFAVGMTMLSVGLRRARIAARWSAICIAAGAIGLSLVGLVPASAYAVAVSVVFAVGLVPLGLWELGVRAPGDRASVSTHPRQSDMIAG
jgi:Domain of unknown function (DUF4386)